MGNKRNHPTEMWQCLTVEKEEISLDVEVEQDQLKGSFPVAIYSFIISFYFYPDFPRPKPHPKAANNEIAKIQ